jgi:hypothetical protein
MGGMINAHKILTGKPEGKRPLGRPEHRWEDIRRDLGGKDQEVVEWIHLAHKGSNGGLLLTR